MSLRKQLETYQRQVASTDCLCGTAGNWLSRFDSTMQLAIGWFSTMESHSCDFKPVNTFSSGNFEPINGFLTLSLWTVFPLVTSCLCFPWWLDPTNVDDLQGSCGYHKRRAITFGAHMTGMDTVGWVAHFPVDNAIVWDMLRLTSGRDKQVTPGKVAVTSWEEGLLAAWTWRVPVDANTEESK